MSYVLITFDAVDLPVGDHRTDMSTGQVDSALADSINGAYDHFGSGRRLPKKQLHQATGVIIGELSYLVDESGDNIVDESGNFIVGGGGAEDMRFQVDAIRAKLGKVGSLIRERDDSAQQWKTARMLNMNWPRADTDRMLLATITTVFETLMAAWHAASATTSALTIPAGMATAINVNNAGEAPIDDAVITVTTSVGITGLTVTCAAMGVDWSWTGALGAGETLTIDTNPSDPTITDANGDAAYSGFEYGDDHTATSWLPLAVGDNQILVTVAGGAATVTITHYDQWY